MSADLHMETAELHRGRPYGGVALLRHQELQNFVFPLNTSSARMVAVLVKSQLRRVLELAVYMPCDCICLTRINGCLHETTGILGEHCVLCGL